MHSAPRPAATGDWQGWGLAQQNVAALAQAPKVEAEEITILTDDQIARLLKRVEGRTIRPIISIGVATGARRGELLALRIKDFDDKAQTLRIERSVEQTKAGLRIKPPKTRNAKRSISLPAFAAAELRAHILRLNERRLALGLGRAGGDDLLFPTWDGQLRSPNQISLKFRLALKSIGVTGATFHSLRHTHASALIAAGFDPLTISRRLGHGSATITLAVYGHLMRGTDPKAAEMIENIFGGLRTD